MASIKNNYTLKGVSGRIGDQIYRPLKNGASVVSKSPDRSKVKQTRNQKKQSKKFTEAVAYARFIVANPSFGKDIKVKKHSKLYNAAIAVFMKQNDSLKDILPPGALQKQYAPEDSLNARQLKVITWAKKNSKVTNADYQRITKISKPTATRDLQELVKKKLLKPSGTHGAGAFYILIGSPENK